MDHRGIALNSIMGSLAHLRLARAYAVAGDGTKAKVAHEDFFALWKDGDHDIPITRRLQITHFIDCSSVS